MFFFIWLRKKVFRSVFIHLVRLTILRLSLHIFVSILSRLFVLTRSLPLFLGHAPAVCQKRTDEFNRILPRQRVKVRKYIERACASQALGGSYENAYVRRWQWTRISKTFAFLHSNFLSMEEFCIYLLFMIVFSGGFVSQPALAEV